MTKFIKIIRFIKRHRKEGTSYFRVTTTADEFIISANNFGSEYYEQLRIKYK